MSCCVQRHKNKINGACEFERRYYLPSTGNVSVPSVTTKEIILFAKIYLPETFLRSDNLFRGAEQEFCSLVLHSFLLYLSSETG